MLCWFPRYDSTPSSCYCTSLLGSLFWYVTQFLFTNPSSRLHSHSTIVVICCWARWWVRGSLRVNFFWIPVYALCPNCRCSAFQGVVWYTKTGNPGTEKHLIVLKSHANWERFLQCHWGQTLQHIWCVKKLWYCQSHQEECIPVWVCNVSQLLLKV